MNTPNPFATTVNGRYFADLKTGTITDTATLEAVHPEIASRITKALEEIGISTTPPPTLTQDLSFLVFTAPQADPNTFKASDGKSFGRRLYQVGVDLRTGDIFPIAATVEGTSERFYAAAEDGNHQLVFLYSDHTPNRQLSYTIHRRDLSPIARRTFPSIAPDQWQVATWDPSDHSIAVAARPDVAHVKGPLKVHIWNYLTDSFRTVAVDVSGNFDIHRNHIERKHR